MLLAVDGPNCEALRFATSLRTLDPRDPDLRRRHCEALRFATSLRIEHGEGIDFAVADCEALRFATSLRVLVDGARFGPIERLRSFMFRNFVEEPKTPVTGG